jgi:hypothetical protein
MAAGDILHHECGMHRGTAPSASGRVLDRFEQNMQSHNAAGDCPIHSNARAIVAAAGGENCEACGQLADYHGGR